MAEAEIAIGPERPEDREAIHRLIASAFPTEAEADLVDRLRAEGALTISLVARDADGGVVGHVGFSPVTVEGSPSAGVGLAPLAVAPGAQGRGTGGRLVAAGLDACRAAGLGFAVVLGSPAYYGRFGFGPASRHGLDSIYGAGDAFMVAALRPGGIPAPGGLVRFGPAFAIFEG